MGRGFESLRARYMVGMAQLASAPDCGSGGRGFESLYPPLHGKVQGRSDLRPSDTSPQVVSGISSEGIMGYRQAVRHRTLTPACAGSNPASPVHGPLAQVVEHLTFNQVVWGSNPQWFTKMFLSVDMGIRTPGRHPQWFTKATQLQKVWLFF